MRYFNGEVRVSATDLSSTGFGLPWGQSRSWTNQLSEDFEFGNGMNWIDREQPVLGEANDGTVFVVLGFDSIRFFAPVGGNDYAPLYGARDALTYDDVADTFTFITRRGTEWTFFGLDTPDSPRGRLKSYKTRGGIEVTLTYVAQQLTEASRSYESGPSETTTLKYVYEYLGGSDPNAGQLERITLRRQVNSDPEIDVKRVHYSYHTGTTANGNLGDLKQVQVERWDGTGWLLESGNYYRYYIDNAGGIGYAHGLRYALGAEALMRLLLVLFIADPDNATNAQLAEYADEYFEYDPSTRRVTKETVDGGSRTFTFSYTERTSTPLEDYNVWQMKTIETRPSGGGEVTVYTNYIGQVLLRQLRDGTSFWYDYYRYDADGRLIEHATPSAVVSFDDAEQDLDVELRTGAGLIRVYSYYASDSSTAAQGYLHFEAVKQGSGGTAQRMREYEYGTQTAGDATVRPVTKETMYRNDNNTGAIETTYDYDYFPSTVQVEQQITTIPAVPTSQNGTNTTAERWEYFDEFGNVTFVKDERGYITAHQYDPATQVLVRTIQDADSDLPSGWTALSGSHLNLTTDYEVDSDGRTVQVLGPEHEVDGQTVRTAIWTVYKDLIIHLGGVAPGIYHEVWTTQGYLEGSTYYVTSPAAPVSVTRQDAARRTVVQVVAKRYASAPTARLSAAEVYSDQAQWTRCTVNLFDNESQLEATRVYHLIPLDAGSEGTNYGETRYLYDGMDRQDGIRSAGGTITRTTYDVRGLQTEQWIGTNDNGFAAENFESSGTNNLRLVTAMQYDNGSDMANGNLTTLTVPVDATSGHDRVTTYLYDFRDRRTVQSGPKTGILTNWIYDNLDRVTLFNKLNFTFGLITRLVTHYDERGQVYQMINYEVIGSLTPGNPLTDNFWYDDAGNQIQAWPAGSSAWTKSEYDALGRGVKTFQGYGSGDPDSVSSDTLFQQTETAYDDAGNVIQTTRRRRFHNANSTTGELKNPTTQPLSRVTYEASWYDPIGRTIAMANYGDNGGSALSRPASAPSSSATVHVSTMEYDAAGDAFKAIDAAGRESRQEVDAAGRRTKLINNYVDGDPTSGPPDEDQTVLWTYTLDNQVATLTAKNTDTGDQVTTYHYGSTLTESQVARNDLVLEISYPDSTGSSDRVKYGYNRQGERTKQTDQNGTVHEYEYDVLGMLTVDRVATLGTGIDGAVRRLVTTYDDRDLVVKVTSYDAASGGNVVNEVQYAHNGFNQVVTEYQEHGGAVNTGTSQKVEYAYEDGTSNTIRRTSLTYPNGRELTYVYNTGHDDELSRISWIEDDDMAQTHLAEYTYLGLGDIVKVDYTQPDVRYDLATGSGATTYAGLDRFDRIATDFWQKYSGTPADFVKLGYAYDEVNNRLHREDFVAKAQTTPQYFDELYTYDGLNRLVDLQRGELSGGSITNRTFRQNWQELSSPFDSALDPTGNWALFNQDDNGDGTWELNQARTHNVVNELTGYTSGAWFTPVYDAAGNVTRMPTIANPSSSSFCDYDAWNRLVALRGNTVTIAEFTYDGLHRRIFKSNLLNEMIDYYYSDQWQDLEERWTVDDVTQTNRQCIWGLRYIDDLVLRDRDTNGDGTLNQRIYALQDANFNVVAQVQGTSVAKRQAYEAYGQPIFLTPTFTAGSSTLLAWEYHFAGYYWDRESGLYPVRHRYLHTRLGRWLTRDPEESGANLYEYGGNKPISVVDPLGLESKPCCGLDATDKFKAGISAIEAKFNASSENVRYGVCNSLIGIGSWDMHVLYEGYQLTQGSCGAGRCKDTVTLFGHCFPAIEANYYLWGFARHLCHKFLSAKYGTVSRVIVGPTEYMVRVAQYNVPGKFFPVITLENTLDLVVLRRIQRSFRLDFQSPVGRLLWTTAGWHRRPFIATIAANIDDECSPCAMSYNDEWRVHIGAKIPLGPFFEGGPRIIPTHSGGFGAAAHVEVP